MDEEQATQLTQGAYDPRRMGRNNSGLSDQDISDVLCILHPCSPAAFKIVANTADRSPQNVLQNHSFDEYDDGVSQSVLEEQETFILNSDGSTQAMDLALRFSAKVLRQDMQFVFGRNAEQCDVVVDTDTVKRVSNVHFRIYINESGVLMLEDFSTNGTIVDEIVLRGKQSAEPQKRMLTAGSIIQILSPKVQEVVKFIVRIPSREGHIDEYEARFQRYMQRVATAKANKEAQQAHHLLAKRLAPTRNTTQRGSIKAPLVQNQYGMHWSGGEKYNVVGHIGKGAFAMVYQLATKNDGQLYAAKELEKRKFMKNGVLDRKVDNELQIMKAVNHPNVVQYVDYQDAGNHLYIIMEFVPCGDLQQYLNLHGPLPEDLARTMAYQVFDALEYLHKNKITHRDIKPDNILIANLDPRDFTIKLSDFGLSKVVKDNETFLKTFCGTLLYCAPEVFPHYDAHVAGKGTKRPRRSSVQQAKKFHSYSQSVDIWSFGAVLWFSLCIKPPFEGVADNTGRGMFDKIMMTPLDHTDLLKQGVSDDAVALLVEMLNTDPAARPLPAYCLRHKWFGDTQYAEAEDFESGLIPIAEEDEHEGAEEPDVSGLSLDELESSQNSEVSLHSGDMEFFDPRQSKRFKSVAFDYREQDSMVDSSPGILFDQIPIVNQADSATATVNPKPALKKLFGEISQSAFESSAVLGARANDATGNSSGQSDYSDYGNGQVEDAQQTHEVPGRGAVASPSLLGAESLVRDLNMRDAGTPNSGSSPAAEPNEPTTPNTPGARPEPASIRANGTPNEITPRAPQQPTFSRQINLPITASFFYDPDDPSTHTVEHASKVSGHDFVKTPSFMFEQNEKSMPDTLHGSLTEDDEDQRQQDENQSAESPRPQLLPPPAEFVKPPPRLGRLVSTLDSAPAVALNLSSRETTWGRAPYNTHIYSDSKDTRVPKRGIILKWHARGIDKVPETGDWMKLPGLYCAIATDSSGGIWVNGVHLTKSEAGRYTYGRLYNGDEVVVWPKEPRLKFTVELFHGEGKEKRLEGGPKFKVETDAPIVKSKDKEEGSVTAIALEKAAITAT